MGFAFFQRLAEYWRMLNASQRFALTLAILFFCVVGVVVINTLTTPKYVQLYGNLSSEDASIVIQKLKERKVPYRLSSNGTTIDVPEASVDETRLALAGEGIPRGGNVGFELFDKTELGISEFGEHLKYIRALQGEIARTIEQLQPVSRARVHLAMPEQRLYASEQEQPSASVELTLRGTPLTPKEVRAVIFFVASAVEGLNPSRVTVVDTQGHLLSELPGVVDTGTGTTQMEIQREAEMQLEERLQRMLDRVLGPNKALITVNMVMNFDKTHIDRETYLSGAPGAQADSASGVLESQQTVEENYGGKQGSAVTPPVLPAQNSSGAAASGYSRRENSSSFRVPRQVEQTDVAPGQVKRTKLALVVDESIPPERVEELKQTLATAAGIDRSRLVDDVAVTTLDFGASTSSEKDEAKSNRMATLLTIGKYLLAALLLFGFLFIIRSMYHTTLSAPLTEAKVSLGAHAYPMISQPEHAIDQYAAALPQQERDDIITLNDEFALKTMEAQRIARVIKGLMTEDHH